MISFCEIASCTVTAIEKSAKIRIETKMARKKNHVEAQKRLKYTKKIVYTICVNRHRFVAQSAVSA